MLQPTASTLSSQRCKELFETFLEQGCVASASEQSTRITSAYDASWSAAAANLQFERALSGWNLRASFLYTRLTCKEMPV